MCCEYFIRVVCYDNVIKKNMQVVVKTGKKGGGQKLAKVLKIAGYFSSVMTHKKPLRKLKIIVKNMVF